MCIRSRGKVFKKSSTFLREIKKKNRKWNGALAKSALVETSVDKKLKLNRYQAPRKMG